MRLGVEDGWRDGGRAGCWRGWSEEEGEVGGTVEVEGKRTGRGGRKEVWSVLVDPSDGWVENERQLG